MIFFKPTVSSDCQNTIFFEAIENDAVYASCTLITDGTKAEIIALSFDESRPYLCEGIIKSAFNYACLRNCYMGYINIHTDMPLLDRMGFQKENGTYFNDIPSILQGNCCKKQ